MKGRDRQYICVCVHLNVSSALAIVVTTVAVTGALVPLGEDEAGGGQQEQEGLHVSWSAWS